MGVIDGGLSWKLSDAGMGLLERAGLAALHMTLHAAEENIRSDPKAAAVVEAMTWESPCNDCVTIRWRLKSAKESLTKLFQFAWQVRDGVLYLPGVHRSPRVRDTYFLRLADHKGILATFLQHNRVEPRGPWTTRVETIDEDKELSFAYQPLETPFVKPHRDLETGGFFNRKGAIADKPVKLASWVAPGMSPRWGSEGAWEGTSDMAILMMLSPVSCLYQQIQGENNSTIYVVPDVRGLQGFDEIRPEVALDPVSTAGPGDAALHFVAEYASRRLRGETVAGCRVVAVGVADYYHSNNKTRKGIVDVVPALDQIPKYRILHRVMASRFLARPDPISTHAKSNPAKKAKGAKSVLGAKELKRTADQTRPVGRIRVPSSRGRIADNLISKRPWYSDLLTPPKWERESLENQRKQNPGKSVERIWLDNLQRYERERLMTLANDERFWSDPQERLFHEAFRKVLWRLCKREKEAAATGRGARGEKERIEDLYDDLHRRLTRASTQQLLRQELTRVLADPPGRFSRAEPLRENPAAIWTLLNDRISWKKARDLALFTLASYGEFNGNYGNSEAVNTTQGE